MGREKQRKMDLMAGNFISEAEMQKLIIEAIESGDIIDLISDDAKIDDASNRTSENQFPQFSIDHITRQLCQKAGYEVLSSLGHLLVMTSDNNVSITKGEILRPDIVCINPEQESIVLFELKKETATGRQALTELLAYEQEVRNLLPLMADYDVNYVLISPEWSVLMDHAVSAAISLSGKKVLCLEARKEKSKLALSTRLPQAWKITGSVFFPEDAIPCVTVCLYDKEPNRKKDDDADKGDLDKRVITAMNIIAREGDKVGAHGFALLWKDEWEQSLTAYNITICGLSPFSFFESSRFKDIIRKTDGKLVAKLDDFISSEAPSGHSESMMNIAQSADPILKEFCNPTLEGFSVWQNERLGLNSRALPLYCEFWGLLGDYSRSFVLHPAIRKHRRNILMGGTSDWTDPRVGLPLIKSFTKPDIFFEGNVRCSDAFRLGLLLGLDRMLRANLKQKQAGLEQLSCMFAWNRIELMSAVDEIALLANAAENVAAPTDGLEFYEDPLVDDEKSFEKIQTWLLEEFFQNSALHMLFYKIGFESSHTFYSHQRNPETIIASEGKETLHKDFMIALHNILKLYKQLESENGFYGDLEAKYKAVLSALGLKPNYKPIAFKGLTVENIMSVWDIILDASDRVLEPAFHKHSPVASASIDWTWLKQGVDEMIQRGIEDAGVIFLPNGQLVTGKATPGGMPAMMTVEDSDKEVLFLDQTNGIGFLKRMKWAELEMKFQN